MTQGSLRWDPELPSPFLASSPPRQTSPTQEDRPHPGGPAPPPSYRLHSSTKASRSSLLGFFCLS